MDSVAGIPAKAPTIYLEELTPETFHDYCDIGKQAYNEHYLHLWPNADPTPYFDSSFTFDVLENELKNPNTRICIIRKGALGIGILKLVIDKGVHIHPPEVSMLLEKVYVLNKFTGQGSGLEILKLVENYAQSLGKSILWLEAMKKGRALSFYKQHGFSIIQENELPFKESIPEERGMYILKKEV
ncbi:MAG: GNAT family N-acetyltransferase [Eudoraea sp.]|nr:GNAT family N-acetyltransferase [Eudoraea sp.]